MTKQVHPDLPQTLADLDIDALVGKTVEVATAIVERAGGEVRTVAPDGALTLDWRPIRVTLVVENDRVISADGFS